MLASPLGLVWLDSEHRFLGAQNTTVGVPRSKIKAEFIVPLLPSKGTVSTPCFLDLSIGILPVSGLSLCSDSWNETRAWC